MVRDPIMSNQCQWIIGDEILMKLDQQMVGNLMLISQSRLMIGDNFVNDQCHRTIWDLILISLYQRDPIPGDLMLTNQSQQMIGDQLVNNPWIVWDLILIGVYQLMVGDPIPTNQCLSDQGQWMGQYPLDQCYKMLMIDGCGWKSKVFCNVTSVVAILLTSFFTKYNFVLQLQVSNLYPVVMKCMVFRSAMGRVLYVPQTLKFC